MNYSKIAIIGAGAVGSTTAYTLMLANCVAEIVLIDIDEQRCRGEVLDLSDLLSFCETSRVRTGAIHDAKDADIIIITAGTPQQVGQSRAELLDVNKKIIAQVLTAIQSLSSDTIIIMVTNPVDLLTLYAQTCAKLPRNQIFGSGTLLDTQRLCGRIAQKVGVAARSVHAYILGEHGDSQFPLWLSASIGGVPLLRYPGMTQEVLDAMARDTRDTAYDIIACKGATYYGVASCITILCKAILFDQKLVLPVSCYQKQFDLCLSVPVVLGRRGIELYVPLVLDKKEQDMLEHSAQQLKKYR